MREIVASASRQRQRDVQLLRLTDDVREERRVQQRRRAVDGRLVDVRHVTVKTCVERPINSSSNAQQSIVRVKSKDLLINVHHFADIRTSITNRHSELNE